ncbi:MAG: OsmC family protein [Dongiaceae bacterium]
MSTNAMKKPVANIVNGIDVDALMGVVQDVTAAPAKGMVEFRVKSAWKGQTRSEATVESYKLGGETFNRRFTFGIDEPLELLGENTAPNPQEYLMAALNACVMVGYVAGAAIRGIKLESVEIETQGELDLRGFLGIDPDVKPGYDRLHYTVRIKGNGTTEQFREIHETVIKTSPNYFNIAKPVAIDADLVVVK